MFGTTYSERPAVVVWEMTRACRLACVHCRAEARGTRDPRELDTEEGRALIDQVAAARPSLLILTGGDPSRRDDLMPLIEHATGNGLRVAFSPGATPDLLALDFERLKASGICRVSLSLDGATKESHDAFRGVSRAWDWTMEAMIRLRKVSLPFQINSTITSRNVEEFDRLCELVKFLRPAGWTIFLVVPTGRAGADEMPQPGQVEDIFRRLLKLSREVDFEIRTTEGQHYRRVVAQNADGGKRMPVPPPVNDAKGFVFVSHIGEICPSGFLPMVAGNIRDDGFLETYKDSPLFRQLRDPLQLKGKCGRCGFNTICGGSRARACGLTGDPLAEDPLCVYQP
ncbi:MAG: TIGR04053 family radical SAM/SPASM domain-containing protein [Terrimicrobiaceae bacterium]